MGAIMAPTWASPAFRLPPTLKPVGRDAANEDVSRGLALLQVGLLSEAKREFGAAIQNWRGCQVAWVHYAGLLYVEGDLGGALECYVVAKGLQGSMNFEASMGCGCVLRELGRGELAAEEFRRAVLMRPGCSVARANFASSCYERGWNEMAIEEFKTAIVLNPHFPDAYNNMGNALRALGRVSEAEASYRTALQIAPAHPHALNNLGNALRGRGAWGEAITCYMASLTSSPGFAAAHCNFAGLLRDQGKPQVAETHYRIALQNDPNMAEAAAGLATALRDMGRAPEAVTFYETATRLQPHAADHHANLGNTYKDLGRVEDSIRSYRAALDLSPNLPDAFCNMAHSLAFICDWRRRKKHLSILITIIDRQLTVLLPNYDQQRRLDRHRRSGRHDLHYQTRSRRVTDNSGEIDDGTKSFVGSRKLMNGYVSDDGDANGPRYYHRHMYGSFHNSTPHAVNTAPRGQMKLLGVSDSASTHSTLSNMSYSSRRTVIPVTPKSPKVGSSTFGVISTLPSVQPFHALIYPLTPEKFRALSICYALRASAMVSGLSRCVHRWTYPNPRLKIGYVSSDFANHPFAHLTQSIYGLHRGNPTVEIFCYALSASDNSVWRKNIESSAEHFTDISKMPAAQAAQTIANDGIHVLINCNGYTKGARTEIFALRPAPVQVSFMGFPGPLGASYIEYFVTDPITSPIDLAHRIHTEALLYHPHTYFVNDHRRSSPAGPRGFPGKAITRARYGLPDDCFLFCNFNQLYKLDPDTFDTWARILHRTPFSKLWLLRFPAAAEERIREEAVKRGLSPDRIIFTDVAAKQEHVARCALGDLFLDTPTCNAHTTGTDALWSGVPMVTCPGQLFASRVAASLLTSVELPELICRDMAEYEELAVTLATSPRRLREIRTRLENGRNTCTLFDTERWVRNFEGLLWEAWKTYDRGEQPKHIFGMDVGPRHERNTRVTLESVHPDAVDYPKR